MDKDKNIDEQNDDMQQLRARFYSSMNYNEYVSVFDKPPQKPEFRPVKQNVEDQFNDLNLDDQKTDDSLKMPEVRKPSQSVNFMIGKYSSSTMTNQTTTAVLIQKEPISQEKPEVLEEIDEEDQFETEFSISTNKMDQGYKNRNRSQSENSLSIFSFLERTRKQSLAN